MLTNRGIVDGMFDTVDDAHRKGFMACALNRLYDRASDRWTSWLAVRRCIRLARADVPEFDELTCKAKTSLKSLAGSSGLIPGNAGSVLVSDDELAVAIAELSVEQRLVLHLFKQGATHREIGAALQLSDERALNEIKILLCRLADQLYGSIDRQACEVKHKQEEVRCSPI
jgi:hypothetical protein